MVKRRTAGKRSLARPSRMPLTLIASVALLLAALTLTACGSSGSGGSDGEDGDTTTTTGSSAEGIVHPKGPDEIVVRVETGGGFVPVEYNLTATPEFSLYGDGRVIETGPTILIYPGPALPNLQTTVISEEAIQGILEAAREAGLFDPTIDYGQPGITDVGTTTFTINADGQTYRTDIYALGMEEGAGGLTMEQQQARAAVSDFRAKLMDLTAFETEEIVWEPFEYEALDVFSRAVDPAASPDPADVQPNRLAWPLDDLATAGAAVQPEGYRRVTVTGDDLATLKPLLDEATQITIWESAGKDYNLSFRPLLPDEAP